LIENQKIFQKKLQQKVDEKKKINEEEEKEKQRLSFSNQTSGESVFGTIGKSNTKKKTDMQKKKNEISKQSGHTLNENKFVKIYLTLF
jgi:hypothetical protein